MRGIVGVNKVEFQLSLIEKTFLAMSQLNHPPFFLLF